MAGALAAILDHEVTLGMWAATVEQPPRSLDLREREKKKNKNKNHKPILLKSLWHGDFLNL